MKTTIIKISLLTVFLVFFSGMINAQTPDQQFQKGIMKEEGEGSLKEAIELYKSVADNTKADKVLRAKALYQMGNCYEKLGQQEARSIYEKLVANYTDPQELVANAKRKLNKLSSETSSDKTGITLRQITEANQWENTFSPDGKYVLSYNWDEVSLYVKDKRAGKSWRVSPVGASGLDNNGVNEDHYPESVMWSPDSKYIAYTWCSQISYDGQYNYKSELRIVGLDGNGTRTIRTDNDITYMSDWSSDGEKILFVKYDHPKDSVKMLMVSADDGKEKALITLGKKWIGQPVFTDDEKFIVFDVREDAIKDNWDIYSIPAEGGEMNKLISFPEYDAEPNPITGTNQFIFLSKHSGAKGLWSMEVENGKLKGEPKILKSGLEENSSLLKVLKDGTALFSTYRTNPDFYYAKLDLAKNDVVLHPFSFARNSMSTMIKTIWSPSLKKVAAMVADPFVSQGVIQIKIIGYDLKTGEKTEIPSELRTFPFLDWIEPLWIPGETSVITKAQTIEFDKRPRGFYEFDFSSKNVKEYMTKEQAWSGLHWKWLQFSPDGKTQYFASVDSNFNYPVQIISRSIETGEEKVITQFHKEIKKFHLSPDGKSIAVKYENTLQIILVNNPSEVKKIENLDENWGTLLGWTSDSKSVLVQKPVDKKTWAIWLQSLDGQNSREVISADKLKSFFGASGLMLHYVGNETYLSMQNGEMIYELWAVENIAQK